MTLVDGVTVLRSRSSHGILDNHLFHDNVHPTLRGHIFLAEAVLSELKARAAFGWPESVPSPVLESSQVAADFNVNAAACATVCRRTAAHYDRLASLLFDPAERLAWRDRYNQAANKIEAGAPPESAGVPGLAVRQ